jgi:hypothetical protein
VRHRNIHTGHNADPRAELTANQAGAVLQGDCPLAQSYAAATKKRTRSVNAATGLAAR